MTLQPQFSFTCLVIASAVIPSTLAAQPLNNPVATFYSDASGYPGWTDRLAWSNVIDMSTHAIPGLPGAGDFEKFEHARDLLHEAGGGVLYYPAGTYTFQLPDMGVGPGRGPLSRGLMLKEGVIIRGETPTGDAWARPTASYPDDGILDLPTKFNFEFQTRGGGEVPLEWNLIGLMPDWESGETVGDVDDVGIVWVELNGAIIYWGPSAQFASRYTEADWIGGSASKDDWPGGTGSANVWSERVPEGTFWADVAMGRVPLGELPEGEYLPESGSGRLIMGCMLRNSTVFNDVQYVSRNRVKNGGPDTFANFRFAARVSVSGEKVFVANNSLPFPEKNFTYQQKLDKDINLVTRNVSAGNLTASGGVATLVYPSHGVSNGQKIEISNVLEEEYEGAYYSTVLDANTLTYPVDPSTPSTATPDVSSISLRYAVDLGTTTTVLFDYANSNGIDINKGVMGALGPGFTRGDWVTCTPGKGYYREGVVMRDNFVFSRGMKGFEMSGMWATAMNNRNQRYYLGKNFPAGYVSNDPTLTSMDGVGFENWVWQTSETASDYMSRGFDVGGRNVWIHNTVIENTGSIGNDGEGILVQRHTGIELYSHSYTYNEQKKINYGPGTSGENGYIASYDVHNYGLLSLGNIGPGYTGHVKGASNVLLDTSLASNNMNGYFLADGGDSASGAFVSDWAAIEDSFQVNNVGGTDTPGYTPTDIVSSPSSVVVATDSLSAAIRIEYVDATSLEVGYRIERKIGSTGSWETIAYRPRQSTVSGLAEVPTKTSGTGDQVFRSIDTFSSTPINDLNPAAWMDFTAPPNQQLYYRVVALNAQDDNSASSPEVGPVMLHYPVVDPHAAAFPVQMAPSTGLVDLVWHGYSGWQYHVESSADLSEWAASGPVYLGADGDLTHGESMPVSGAVFLRVEAAPAPDTATWP